MLLHSIGGLENRFACIIIYDVRKCLDINKHVIYLIWGIVIVSFARRRNGRLNSALLSAQERMKKNISIDNIVTWCTNDRGWYSLSYLLDWLICGALLLIEIGVFQFALYPNERYNRLKLGQ